MDGTPADIFDPKLYAAQRRPLLDAETLPPWCYTSEAFYRREVETIFMKVWNFLGRTDQVPNPGDYYALEFAGVPLIIVRDRDMQVRAFANTCRHRGSLLLDEGTGNCRAIKCPYHGWVYGLDGALNGAPDMEEALGFRREDHGLVPLRLETWDGFMFVNFDPKAVPLMEFLGDLPAILKSHDLPNMKTVRRREYILDCNWKLFVENAMEGYHIPTVHQTSLSRHKAKKPAVQKVKGEFVLLYTQQKGTRALMPGDTGFPEIPSLDERGQNGSYYPNIYPSTMFCCTQDCMWYLEVHPMGPHRMKLTHGACFPEETTKRNDFQDILPRYYKRWDKTADEDNNISEVQHRGLLSPLAETGRMSYLEPLVHTIGNWVLDRVLGDTTPAGRDGLYD
ncbi:MAG: aromatic ring-hydroxylating dioxygenase subunit alpha [Alphaproteobacteria bacterium]|nr:aromatic ring-hydroxylating dioxygenase subunit alpha [Alphaproteobacteria bacterium]